MASPSREEFKRLARELAVDSIVTDSLARLLEQVIATVVANERARCVRLVLDTADERRGSGDPEGEGVLTDLAKLIKRS